MMNSSQLRDLIIKPALSDLVMLSDNAIELMMFTCAVESLGGTYLKQLTGPALGIYQMEPATYNDIWQNYIANNSKLLLVLLSNFGCHNMSSEDRLVYDLRFATAMTRIHYARVPQALPLKDDIEAMWDYYKEHYNSSRGAAEKAQSIQKYYTFIKS